MSMESLMADWIFALSVSEKSSLRIVGPTGVGGLFLAARLVAFPTRGKESTGSRIASMQPIIKRSENSIVGPDIE